jgi:Flp pilus assembly pilin Flp
MYYGPPTQMCYPRRTNPSRISVRRKDAACGAAPYTGFQIEAVSSNPEPSLAQTGTPMCNWQPLQSELRTFLADDCGGSLLEYTLVAALVIVVGTLIVLAVRKVTVAPV